MKKKLFSLVLIVSLMANSGFVKANAEVIEDNQAVEWFDERMQDYEPYQEKLEEYPEMENVQASISYILIEDSIDKKGNVIDTNQEVFDNLDDMNAYEEEKLESNNIKPFVVNPGDIVYKTYSKMKVGLALYKYTSSRFFVSYTYEWLTLPSPGAISTNKIRAVVGLALNPQLSIDSSTYDGRVSYTTDWVQGTQFGQTSYMKNVSNGGITIKPSGTQGIGYSFSVPHYTGANFNIVTSMSGNISCTAFKSNTNDNYCSALGSYADVTTTLSLDSFSVSIPAGISFGAATSYSSYNLQDSLYIK